jgi:hypothetical protein
MSVHFSLFLTKNVRPLCPSTCPSTSHFSVFKWCSSVQVGEASGRSIRRGTKIAAERPKSRPCGIQYIAVVIILHQAIKKGAVRPVAAISATTRPSIRAHIWSGSSLPHQARRQPSPAPRRPPRSVARKRPLEQLLKHSQTVAQTPSNGRSNAPNRPKYTLKNSMIYPSKGIAGTRRNAPQISPCTPLTSPTAHISGLRCAPSARRPPPIMHEAPAPHTGERSEAPRKPPKPPLKFKHLNANVAQLFEYCSSGPLRCRMNVNRCHVSFFSLRASQISVTRCATAF